MVQFYFFSGILRIGKEFAVQGDKVSLIRQEKKPRLKEKLFFQDKNGKRYLCEVTGLKSRLLKFLVIKEKEIFKKFFFFDLYLPILPKKDLQTFLFQATELGVNRFFFFESKYSRKILNIDQKKIFFWKQILFRACENSGVSEVPSISLCGKLEQIVQNLKEKKISFCVLHPQQITKKKLVMDSCKLAIFVGPKKGFSDEELAMMDCPQIDLGQNWLKPQTAGLGALAIFQYLCGNFKFDK